jgi:hypothetical protein
MRPEHAALHGVQVKGVDSTFTLAGFPARFPGDPTLPASQRVNCLCTILSVTVADGLEAETLEA